MTGIQSVAALKALCGTPSWASVTKVVPALTPRYRRWIERAR